MPKHEYHPLATTQARCCREKKAYENRADWTISHPAKHKSAPWQSDYVGVVHLSRPDQHFWVGIYLLNGVPARLRLQEKDGLGDKFNCRLFPKSFGRFEGRLAIAGVTLIARLQPDRHPQTGVRRYRVHFEQGGGL